MTLDGVRWVARLVVLAALVCAARANAAPARKVVIDSQPRGASIYLGEKEAGAAGVTPLTLDLPVGETVVIIELENHVPKFETITVPKGKGKPLKINVRLEPAAATIVVAADGPLRGARIVVDGEDEAAAPGRVEVPAGTHRVEILSRAGKTLHSEEVTVTAGQEVAVQVKVGNEGKTDGKKGGKGRPKPPKEDPTEPTEEAPEGAPEGAKGGPKEASTSAEPTRVAAADEPREPTEERVEGSVPAGRPEGPRLRFAPLVEVSWRYFEYVDAITVDNTASLRQAGTVLLGARAELVPLRAVENLSFTLAGGYAVPQDLNSNAGMLRATVWRVDAAASYTLGLTRRAGLVALAGYGRSRYRFEGPSAAVALVPDATYSQVRLGAGLRGRLDWFELLALVENRLVLSGGTFSDRFKTASADGLAAHLSMAAHLGAHIFARLDSGVARYDWSFTYEPEDRYRAEGASDLMLMVSLSAGAAF